MRRIFAGLLALLMVLGAAPPGWAGSSSPPAPADAPAPADPEAQADAQEATPPRVSYLHGDVSFWRPGAAGTQIGIDNQEPDYIQLRVTSGYAALDLR